MLWKKAASGTPQLVFERYDDLWSRWWVCRLGVGGGVGWGWSQHPLPLWIHETTEAWRGGRGSPEVPSAGVLWALGPQGGFAWVLPTLPTPPPQDSACQSGTSPALKAGF